MGLCASGSRFGPVNMVRVVLLMVLFVPGTLADCQSDLFITAPNTMEALSGSCLQISCNFSAKEENEFNSTRKTFGVWIKTDSRINLNKNNVIYNSSVTVNKYPMNITGNLSQKNCSTLFSNLTTSHTDTYFFRAENGPYRATAACDSVYITIKDSPWSPSIHISAGDLKEKQSVSITCSALTPCPHSPPQLTWNLHPDSDSETEENTNGTFTTKLQQTITLSHTHDGYNISCSATYPVNGGRNKTAETQQTLSVSYAPKDTSASISPSGLLSAGIWVNLTCSSRAKPPISSFTWFKNTKDGPKKVHEGHMYSLEMTNMADIELHYCVATNALGNQSSVGHSPVTEHLSPWGGAVGGIFGFIIFISVVLALWWLRSTHQAQSPVLQEAAAPAENEDIHYGDIDFSMARAGPPSDSVQDGTEQQQQQVAVYSELNMCQTGHSECVYAPVKKK
ncbi:myelin-associated glycoprotein-like [Parambassis ranga]|uniref:Myelin-associated glycoprotein-like n=1 Tax=Parambassis ranga TaxID=210632 RepID=A0A6P7KG96_9TELE|nr:myelin-associated glycoprotein-like [Parambassis ranga]